MENRDDSQIARREAKLFSKPAFIAVGGFILLGLFATAVFLGNAKGNEGSNTPGISSTITDNRRGSGSLVPPKIKKDYSKATWKLVYDIFKLPNKDAEFHSIAGWDKHNILVLGEISYPGEGHARLLELRLKNDKWICSNNDADGHYAHYSTLFQGPDKYLLYYEGRGPFMGGLVLVDQGNMERLSKTSVPDGFMGMYALDEKSIYFPGRARVGSALYRYYEPMHRIERVDPAQESVLIEDGVSVNSKMMAGGLNAADIKCGKIVRLGEALGYRQVDAYYSPACGPHKGPVALFTFRDGIWHLTHQVEEMRQIKSVWFVDEKRCVTVADSEINIIQGDQVHPQRIVISDVDYTDQSFVRAWGSSIEDFCVMNAKGDVFQFSNGSWKIAVKGPDFKHELTSDMHDFDDMKEMQSNKFSFSQIYISRDGAIFGLRRKTLYMLD